MPTGIGVLAIVVVNVIVSLTASLPVAIIRYLAYLLVEEDEMLNTVLLAADDRVGEDWSCLSL